MYCWGVMKGEIQYSGNVQQTPSGIDTREKAQGQLVLFSFRRWSAINQLCTE